MSRRAPLATYEMDEHIDGRYEDDEITERNDLVDCGHGDDVGEHHQHVVRSLEVASSRELDAVLEAGLDDIGLYQGFGADRHALVHDDRNDVCAQPDGDNAHAGEMQVREREAREQHEREKQQRSREVTIQTRCDDLTGDAADE
jgi:hypothetical protein